MKQLASCTLFLLLAGCTRFVPSSLAPPSLLHRSRGDRARCVVVGSELQCGAVRSDLAGLGVALPLRASAPRVLGGVWLLDRDQTLFRIDSRGRITGRELDSGQRLLVSHEFVCTHTEPGPLHCRIDHHDEAGCGRETSLAPPIDIDPGFTPSRQPVQAVLCGAGPDRAQRCVRLSRPCARGCLRFPGCGAALRCIHACAPDQPAIVARAVALPQSRPGLSSFPPARVTHHHGREPGGYAGARARP